MEIVDKKSTDYKRHAKSPSRQRVKHSILRGDLFAEFFGQFVKIFAVEVFMNISIAH